MVNVLPDTVFIAKDHSRMLGIVPTDPKSVKGKQYKDSLIMAMAYELESDNNMGITKYAYTGLKILSAGALKNYFHF